MKKYNFSVKYLLLTLAAIISLGILSPIAASAESVASTIPLEIVPICSNKTTNSAYWQVTNKNPNNVLVGWSVGTSTPKTSGTYTAPLATNNADSKAIMKTYYDGTDPNNTTSFTYNGLELGSTNARDYRDGGCEEYDTPADMPTPVVQAPPCIDGHIQQNLVVTYTARNTVSINTVNNGLLCDDVTIFFSSYTMPDNYDGKVFEGNITAYPQPIFDSKSVVLAKNTAANTTLTITLPNDCKNTQVDAYYAPEITVVGPGGHGTQNILSAVYLSQGLCAPISSVVQPTATVVVPTPGRGGGALVVVPVNAVASSSTTEQAQQILLPKVLPNTGPDINATKALIVIGMSGFLTSIGAYFIAESFQKRRYYN